jgi:CRP-like cAMP-binding protein
VTIGLESLPYVAPTDLMAGEPSPGLVESNRLLAALPPAALDRLAGHFRDVLLAPGKVLHEPGQTIHDAYFIRQGFVGLLCPMTDGRAIETANVGRDGAVGITAALGAPVACNRAVVYLPVRAAQIRISVLADMAARSQAVRDMVVSNADALFGQVHQAAACNALHLVEQRLCRWLLRARDGAGSDILPVTQEFLADVLGVQRTTITLISRMLQSRGIIQVRRGRIAVRDVKALEGKACECYRVVSRTGEHQPHRPHPAVPSAS